MKNSKFFLYIVAIAALFGARTTVNSADAKQVFEIVILVIVALLVRQIVFKIMTRGK